MFLQLADNLTRWLAQNGVFPADSPVAGAVHFFIQDLSKIFVMLLLVIYGMGLLRAFLSPERVRDFVRGKPTWLSRTLAILLGAVTPFCSCSSVPLFIGFVEAGIPLGVTFSFLIASPMINEVAVVILIGILGLRLTIYYVLAGLLVAYIGGIIMGWFRPERWVAAYVWKVKVGAGLAQQKPQNLRQRHQFALGEVREIFTRVWKWVVLGVAAGALFHGFVPETWVAENLGSSNSLISVPLAVLLGVPLYSNATGVIPVAEALLGKGVPIGTVLALMMSIAALSLPEMIILRKVIHWRALAIYASILAVAFTLVGWSFNLLVDVDLSTLMVQP